MGFLTNFLSWVDMFSNNTNKEDNPVEGDIETTGEIVEILSEEPVEWFWISSIIEMYLSLFSSHIDCFIF